MTFVDHGTCVRDAIKVTIRKDEWIPSKPWFADVTFPDGGKWRNWQQFFKSRKSLISAVQASAPNAVIEG